MGPVQTGTAQASTAQTSHVQSTAGPYRDELGLLRTQLTNLRALLVLAILMTESADDQQILRLATSAAASLGSWQIAGFVIGDAWWAGDRRRPDSITMLDNLTVWSSEKKHRSASMEKRNFEYYMNRGYALNRDKCRCKVCATSLLRGNLQTHHKNPFFPLDQINKVRNLASLCTRCHDLVHRDEPNPFVKGTKPYTKLEAYRKEVKDVF